MQGGVRRLSGAPPLIPVVASHIGAVLDLETSIFLSELIGASVSCKTSATYDTGVRSLLSYCGTTGLCARPLDSVTLCLWMASRSQGPSPLKPKSLQKYICGIRRWHILHGEPWTLANDPIVKLTLAALRKRFPDSDKAEKVILSLPTLLSMCATMPGWPDPARLSYNDLLWATASSLAFFAALRGGEFFTYPTSERPILQGCMVSTVAGRCVKIAIPVPKTRQDLTSSLGFAVSPAGAATSPFCPVSLLALYRARSAQHGIGVLGTNPAFRLLNGSPLSREFMVGGARNLISKANIVFLASDGSLLPVLAASWRAGYVLSARAALVDNSTIRAVGRWVSEAGPLPYTFDNIDTLATANESILRAASTPNPAGRSGGQFYGANVYL